MSFMQKMYGPKQDNSHIPKKTTVTEDAAGKQNQITKNLEKQLGRSKKRIENIESNYRRLVQENSRQKNEIERLSRTLGR